MKTWAVARFTLKETIRTKTMIFGLIFSLLYLAVVPMLSTSGGGTAVVGDIDQTAAGRDFLGFALGGLNFIGMAMAIFTTLGAIYTEIERGTILSLVTKPLHRWQIIVGKWMGHVLLMSGYVLIMGLALWLSVGVGSGVFIWRFFPAIALVCLNIITMVSLTLVFSTFLPVIANAIFVFIMFIFTSNLRIISAIGETSDNIILVIFSSALRLILPVSEVSELASLALAGKTPGSQSIVASETSVFAPRSWSFIYEITYIAIMVFLATLVFRKKDLSQSA
ncbi:MAG: ABC transporter permease subunit [Thermoleophilia bacterium]|jgi:ABC-type transport system involved in multi-copper enzyme maturation permease subunit